MGAPVRVPAETAWVAAVAERLAAGGLVVLPTETVYGLAADAENRAAVRAVFAAKGRPANHPLIVHLADAAMAPVYAAEWPAVAAQLAARFWPGPLTLVVPAAASVLPEVTGGQPTVALRVPAHPFTRAVIAALGRGVVAPSANRFGRVSPTHPDHVLAEFPALDLWVVDGGAAPVGVESTIVDLSRLAEVGTVILRPGAIGTVELAAVLAEAGINVPVRVAEHGAASAAPQVPGALAAHYAPHTPVWLWTADAYRQWCARPEAAAAPPHAVWFPADWPAAANEVERLVQPADPKALARTLYAALRSLDAVGADELWVALPEGEGPLVAAVCDRLRRAAHR